MSLFPLLLAVHIGLAVALFVPSLLLPFALRSRMAGPEQRGPLVRALVWLQSNGTGYVALGLLLTGLGLIAVLGGALLAQPWLVAALVLYAATLALSFLVQRPALRRLFGSREDDEKRWKVLARRQRYVSYVMAAAVGLIAFLMTSKPSLW